MMRFRIREFIDGDPEQVPPKVTDKKDTWGTLLSWPLKFKFKIQIQIQRSIENQLIS